MQFVKDQSVGLNGKPYRQVRVCIALQEVEGAGLSSLLRAAQHSGKFLLLFWTGSKGMTANEQMPSGILLRNSKLREKIVSKIKSFKLGSLIKCLAAPNTPVKSREPGIPAGTLCVSLYWTHLGSQYPQCHTGSLVPDNDRHISHLESI